MEVLIVDDEAPVRRLLHRWVEAEGATVLEAGTAEQGLELVERRGAPAAALCDIRLPGKDGIWLAEQLHRTCPETAVVMTTGVHEFDAAVHSLQAGVVDYLLKPFTRERMTEALHRAFFAHKSRRALNAMQEELETRRQQITEALAEIELNASSSLGAMLAILHTRDPDSAAHAHRVSKMAVNLAMALQIGEPQLSDIERAALLHNLGRVALPDDLLAQPFETLSSEERARFQAFPLHGYAILKNVPYLAGANAIAVAVHERFDGSGFPHGLKGEQIPLGARIIAVADAYDELVSSPPGEPVSPAQAVETLCTTRAAGFDPVVLEALRMLQG